MPPATSHGTYPDFIRALRKELKEDQDTFGRRFDCSGRTIDNWEQGHRRPDKRTRRLLEAEKANLEALRASQPA